MGEINKATKAMVNFCTDCEHSEVNHTKLKKMDQSRISHSKTYLSECSKCDCKEFKPK